MCNPQPLNFLFIKYWVFSRVLAPQKLPKMTLNCLNCLKNCLEFPGIAWNRLNSGESHRPLTPILLKSIAIRLPFLSRYFCKSMPSSWQKAVYTPPICIAIRLPFVSQYFCRSIRVRGRWDTPNKLHRDWRCYSCDWTP